MGYDAYKPADVPTGQSQLASKATTAAGALVAIDNSIGNADSLSGDTLKLIYYFVCVGGETKLDILYYKCPTCGKFDVFLNGISDSTGYDTYGAGFAGASTIVTLTKIPIPGLNTVEFRINGKNVASTGFSIIISVVRLRLE